MSDYIDISKLDLRNRIRKEHPEIAGLWVEFFDGLRAGTILKAQALQDKADFESSISILCEMIADWSIGKNGEKLPITPDNIKTYFDSKMVEWLINSQTEILTSQKDKKKE